jgi:uncharacterized membrane protein YdjX (TVP38/TMEM64 family)
MAVFFFWQNVLTIESLFSYTPENNFLAVVFLLFLFVMKSFSFVFPISVLFALVGIIYPMVPALLLNIAGTLVCIMIGYWIGHFSISNYAEKLIIKYPKLKEFVQKQLKNEWFLSLFLRLCPISCDIVSIYLGSIKMSLKKYFFTGFLGSLPGIISVTLLGVSIENPLSPMCIIAFSMVIVLTVVSFVVYKFVEKRNNS